MGTGLRVVAEVEKGVFAMALPVIQRQTTLDVVAHLRKVTNMGIVQAA
jgi:hypothetical protein